MNMISWVAQIRLEGTLAPECRQDLAVLPLRIILELRTLNSILPLVPSSVSALGFG